MLAVLVVACHSLLCQGLSAAALITIFFVLILLHQQLCTSCSGQSLPSLSCTLISHPQLLSPSAHVATPWPATPQMPRPAALPPTARAQPRALEFSPQKLQLIATSRRRYSCILRPPNVTGHLAKNILYIGRKGFLPRTQQKMMWHTLIGLSKRF